MAMLTAWETGQRLRLSKPTIIKLLNNGIIPGFKVGHVWRIPEAKLDALMRGGGDGKAKSRPGLRAG
jgi:excisionase family DNA binding protein